MELTTKDWKEFRIGDLFDYERGKESAPNQNPEGECKLVSETQDNNGFVRFVEPTRVIEGHCITVSVNFASTVFYQDENFCASVNIIVLRPKVEMTEKQLLFIASILCKKHKTYSYTDKVSKDLLMNEFILLPSKNDEPDWDFMEEFIKEIEEENKEKLAVLKDVKPVDDEIDISDWHEFRLTEIFKNVSKGTRIKQSDRVSGEIPLITAGELNNGFSCYIEKNDTLFKGKCITIDMFGNTFYRDYDFYADDNVIVLNREDLNEFHLLFLTSVIAKATKIYSYVEQFRLKSLSKTLIKLPSIYNQETNEYEPDWEYMEDFITNQQAKIKDQLKELKR